MSVCSCDDIQEHVCADAGAVSLATLLTINTEQRVAAGKQRGLKRINSLDLT